MANTIFYGDFGTGKSYRMLEKIKEAAEKKQKCILFVPEQFSFDTERLVYFSVGAKNIQYVKVTGFSKLSREILNKYKMAKPAADDAVKLITMWKAVDKVKSDFLSLNTNKNSSGLCSLMLKTVAAFKNGGISPEDYEKTLSAEDKLDDELADKANDFLNVYKAYNSLLTENLDDKLDDVSRAAALAEEYGFFKGYSIFFDYYDSFSLSQLKLIKAALDQCDNSIFCLTCDSLNSKKREFLCITKTAQQIKAIAPNTDEQKFERNYRRENRKNNNPDNNPEIEIFAARNPYEEAEIIAAKICHGVRENKQRYRDFLILTADGEYESIISDRLKNSAIPHFCDFPHPMTDRPIVKFILSVLKALSLETEDILALAESGFLRLRKPDKNGESGNPSLIYLKEAYKLRTAAESYDIGANDWEKGFENDSRQELARLDYLRKGIVQPLIKLRDDLNNASDGAEMSRIYMNYLLNEQRIKSTFIAASKSGQGGETDTIETDEETAEEIGRIWDAMCGGFSSMAYCLENTKIGIEDYRMLLEEILSGINLANPPQVLDCVTVGDIERTRKSSPKTVILAGFSRNAIPRQSKLVSIFSDSERESLNETGLPIYDTKINRWSKEYYFAKRTLNLYERNLILTYPYQTVNGTESAPSDILSSDIYKDIPHSEISSVSREYFLNTAYDIKSVLSSLYGKDKTLTDKLEQLLEEAKYYKYGEMAENALTLLSSGRSFKLSPDLARELLEGRTYSPTSLEAAFNCPFMFFGQYGLNLREPDSKDLNTSNNLGTAIHNIMQSALNQVYGNNKDLALMSDDEIHNLAVKTVSEQAKISAAENPTFPERTEAIYSFLLPRIEKLFLQMRLELQGGKFRPAEFEKEVSFAIKDEENKTSVTVKGTADRIDKYVVADENLGTQKEYIRIIDYKTGKPKKFLKENLSLGENLQMLLYLFSECDGKSVLPAGVGYFNAGSPALYRSPSSGSISRQESEKSWYGAHRISGAVFDGCDEMVKQVDKYNENVRNISSAPRTDFYPCDKLESKKFAELREYIEQEVILKKIRSLLKGEIDSVALEKEGQLPCKFCSLKAICNNRGNKIAASAQNDTTQSQSENAEQPAASTDYMG